VQARLRVHERRTIWRGSREKLRMLARFVGGPLDGTKAHVPDRSTIVVMPKTRTTPPWRYVLSSRDPDGTARFVLAGIEPGARPSTPDDED